MSVKKPGEYVEHIGDYHPAATHIEVTDNDTSRLNQGPCPSCGQLTDLPGPCTACSSPAYTDRPELSPGPAFGNQLMLARVARGWSRQDLADEITALGLTWRGEPLTVSAGAITRHENGNRNPRPRAMHAYRLALVLEQTTDTTDTQLRAEARAALTEWDTGHHGDAGWYAVADQMAAVLRKITTAAPTA